MSPADGYGGCFGLAYGPDDIGIEKVPGSYDKERNFVLKAAKVFKDYGIPLNLMFVVGFDEHKYPDIFFRVAQLAEEACAPVNFFFVATPYKGTTFGDKVDKVYESGRVIEATDNLNTPPPVEDDLAIIIANIFKPAEIVRYSQGLIEQYRNDLASQKDNPSLIVPIRRTTSVLRQMVTDAQTNPILRRDLVETNISEFLLPLRNFPNPTISTNAWEILIIQL